MGGWRVEVYRVCSQRERERILKEHEFFLTFSDKQVQLKEKPLERNLQADLASPSEVIFMISRNLFSLTTHFKTQMKSVWA
jgi:hypothetical protein